MGTEDNGVDMRFQSRDAGSIFKSSNGAESYFGSGWDPLVSLSQSENFGPQNGFSTTAYQVVMENQALSSSSRLVHCQSDLGDFGEMVPKHSCFGSGSFSEMVNSFGLPECGQIGYSQNMEGVNGKALLIGTESQEDCLNSEDKTLPNEKKRGRVPGSYPPSNLNNSAEIEQQQDPSGDNNLEMDDNKQKIKHNIHDNSRGKQTSKQGKKNSNSGDAGKDGYIHVRAKRGQATNSHSLAERLRREKISERMRLLQELVPGCNKITGKAVMLDEIINYVQSLQLQVEFLSMKLATVNPEINIYIDGIISKDILSSRVSNEAILGFRGGLMPPHPFPHESLTCISHTAQPFHSMAQAPLDSDLHNLRQMGFDSTSNLAPTGLSNLDL